VTGVRWGVLGTGSIARTVMAAVPGAFVAAASRDRARAAALGLPLSFGGDRGAPGAAPLAFGGADAIAQATAYEALTASARTGEPVNVPVKP
jgi:hypothetical protein